MRHLLFLLCFFLSGCNLTSPTPTQDYVFTHTLSPSADLNFAFLKLHKALDTEDIEAVMEAYDVLLTGESSATLGEALAWLISKGQLNEAQTFLQKTLLVFPDDLPLHIMYAELLLFASEDKYQATIVLENFVNQHPENYTALSELAIFYVKAEEPQKALSVFQQLPESELSPIAHYYIAYTYKLLGELEKTVEHLNIAVQEAPSFLEALLDLAQAHEMLGNFDLAEKYYNEVLEFDKYNNDLLLYLIRLSLKQGNPEKALEIATSRSADYSLAVSAASMLLEEGRADLALSLINSIEDLPEAPDDLGFYQGLLTYEGNSNAEKALEYLEEVPDTSKNYEDTLQTILRIHLDQQNYDSALKTIDKSLEYYPAHLEFLSIKYRTLLYIERYAEAISTMEKLLLLTPNDIELGFNHAFAYSLLGDTETSIELMQELLKKDSENPEILNYLGYSWAEQDVNLNEALEYIEKAIQYSPDSSYILDSLAWVYFRMGEYDKAWENIQKALDLSAKQIDPSMWDHYGDIAYALAKPTEARKGWEKSLQIQESETVRKKLEDL